MAENAATAPCGAVAHSDARRRIPASPSNQVAGTWLVLLSILLLLVGASGVAFLTLCVSGGGAMRDTCPPARRSRRPGPGRCTPGGRGGSGEDSEHHAPR